jgi:hypothetical protein
MSTNVDNVVQVEQRRHNPFGLTWTHIASICTNVDNLLLPCGLTSTYPFLTLEGAQSAQEPKCPRASAQGPSAQGPSAQGPSAQGPSAQGQWPQELQCPRALEIQCPRTLKIQCLRHPNSPIAQMLSARREHKIIRFLQLQVLKLQLQLQA